MALSTAGFLMLAVVYAAAAAAAAAATAGGCNVCEFARGSLFIFFWPKRKGHSGVLLFSFTIPYSRLRHIRDLGLVERGKKRGVR